MNNQPQQQVNHPKRSVQWAVKKHRNGQLIAWCPSCYPYEPCANAVYSKSYDADGNPIWAHDEFHSPCGTLHINDCRHTLPRKLNKQEALLKRILEQHGA